MGSSSQSAFFVRINNMSVKVTLVKPPKDFSSDIDKAIDQSMKELENELEQSIKTNHKYISRTGNLQNASKVDVNKYSLKAYIDNKIADYGKFIHSGTKFISPDPFVTENMESKQEKIIQTITKNINRSITWQ
jgi:Icc-related predicted phosphoesterase